MCCGLVEGNIFLFSFFFTFLQEILWSHRGVVDKVLAL